jgi:hypothetical protein
MAYRTEFTTFAVKIGMEAKAEEWMKIVSDRQAECVETLEREKMHYESIFKVFRNGRMYLSWFSVQSTHARSVEDSPHPIDHIHLAYWKECIDKQVAPEDFEHVVSFVPQSVREAVEARDSSLR